MDGVRAYWDGSKLWSRHGKEIVTPTSFVKELPDVELDGELWMGRGTYEKIVVATKSRENEDIWKEVRYYVFDLPGSRAHFEDRMDSLNKLQFPPHVHKVEHTRCNGRHHLITTLDELLDAGGEGIMLREPYSLYIPTTITSSLLKVKVVSACTQVTVSSDWMMRKFNF